MQIHKFGKRSLGHLVGVHPTLIALAFELLYQSPYDLGISDGVRTKEEQETNVEAGVSWTMDSKHRLRSFPGISTPLAGAFDFFVLINGKAIWTPKTYENLREPLEIACENVHADIIWGHDWKTQDSYHIELAEETELWMS